MNLILKLPLRDIWIDIKYWKMVW